jgi:anaerobic selenocysteine-containing dehydrogenase
MAKPLPLSPVTYHIGGNVAFFYGVLKHLTENGWIDREFIAARRTSWEGVAAKVRSLWLNSTAPPAEVVSYSGRLAGVKAEKASFCSGSGACEISTLGSEDRFEIPSYYDFLVLRYNVRGAAELP